MAKVRVMLVDDEERFLVTTQKLLEKKGYRVETASGGREALEKLNGNTVQVVILDVKMPEMDGIATLKAIKRNHPLVEVILLTGHGTVESAVEGVKLGAANYLTKPVDVDEIAKKIEETLEKREIINTQAEQRKRYFRRLEIILGSGLLIAFMLPYAGFFTYFQYQFNATLKDTGQLNLEALSISKKNTVDLFLQERVVNIFSLFHSATFSTAPSQTDMHTFLQELRQINDAFIDIGFLDANGTQVGYAGPFAYLKGKDYSKENWFRNLVAAERHYTISDVYHGFRGKPHFTIAVKQVIDGNPYLIKSTLDPDKFYMFLRYISRGKEVESSLINRDGVFQLVDPTTEALLTRSDYVPPPDSESGVTEIRHRGGSVLVGYAWLREAPWALLVKQRLNVAYRDMYRSRRLMTAVLAVVFLCVAAGIWFANNRMMRHIQRTVEKKDELRLQLFHASKLASVGELATGVAHEINNPLAIIVATTGVIRDMFNPEFGLHPSPRDVVNEVDTIESAAFRARAITRQLLAFGRKEEPKLAPCDVNQVLEEVLSGVKEREFMLAQIDIEKRFDPGLPEIMLDKDQIRQVFFNLINNAGDAISGPGKISVATGRTEQEVRITVKDTGRGMSTEQIKNIFKPFYTTKETGKGTGLGLSVSLTIVESMGGSIDVQSLEGVGSSFVVSLPIQGRGETT